MITGCDKVRRHLTLHPCPSALTYQESIPANKLFGENSMMIAQIVNETTQTVTQTGIGLGSAIAVVCSWQRNRSILWAILAGIFSWFYVIYFAVSRQPGETK